MPLVSMDSHAELRDVERRPEVLTLLGLESLGTITQIFELNQSTQWRPAWVLLKLREESAYYRTRDFAASFAEATTHHYSLAYDYHQVLSAESLFLDFRAFLRVLLPTPGPPAFRKMIDKLRADLDDWDNEDAAVSGAANPPATRDGGGYTSAM